MPFIRSPSRNQHKTEKWCAHLPVWTQQNALPEELPCDGTARLDSTFSSTLKTSWKCQPWELYSFTANKAAAKIKPLCATQQGYKHTMANMKGIRNSNKLLPTSLLPLLDYTGVKDTQNGLKREDIKKKKLIISNSLHKSAVQTDLSITSCTLTSGVIWSYRGLSSLPVHSRNTPTYKDCDNPVLSAILAKHYLSN